MPGTREVFTASDDEREDEEELSEVAEMIHGLKEEDEPGPRGVRQTDRRWDSLMNVKAK